MLPPHCDGHSSTRPVRLLSDPTDQRRHRMDRDPRRMKRGGSLEWGRPTKVEEPELDYPSSVPQ